MLQAHPTEFPNRPGAKKDVVKSTCGISPGPRRCRGCRTTSGALCYWRVSRRRCRTAGVGSQPRAMWPRH